MRVVQDDREDAASDGAPAATGCANLTVAVVIPAYNEEQSIAGTIREYRRAFPFAVIIVVDNASADATYARAAEAIDPGRDILLRETTRGKGNAMRAAVARIDADVFVFTDADLTYPADDARRLLDLLVAERLDMVVGDRVTGGAYDAQNRRRFHGVGNVVVSWIVSRLAGRRFNDVLSGLRAVSRPLARCFEMRSDGFQIETEFNLTAAYLGADVRELPISYNKRPVGTASKLRTFRDGWQILKFAFSSFSIRNPVPAFAVCAVASFALSLFWGVQAVIYYIQHGAMPHLATAIAAAAFGILAFQLVFSGLMLGMRQAESRRQDAIRFREMKQVWNTRLDAKI